MRELKKNYTTAEEDNKGIIRHYAKWFQCPIYLLFSSYD